MFRISHDAHQTQQQGKEQEHIAMQTPFVDGVFCLKGRV
jgi:hypothetical protein